MSYQLLALEAKVRKAAQRFAEVSDRSESILSTRAMSAAEVSKLDKASSKAARAQSALKAEQRRVADATASLNARDNALGNAAGVGGGNVGGAHVTNGTENLTYSPGNPSNSFYRDLLNASCFSPGNGRRSARLKQHQARWKPSPKRRAPAARKARQFVAICAMPTALALSFVTPSPMVARSLSSPGSPNDMAPFAPPVFFLPEYAEYRTYGRTFLNLLKPFPMPESGMEFFVPKITTPTRLSSSLRKRLQRFHAGPGVRVRRGHLTDLVTNLKSPSSTSTVSGLVFRVIRSCSGYQTSQLNRALNIYA